MSSPCSSSKRASARWYSAVGGLARLGAGGRVTRERLAPAVVDPTRSGNVTRRSPASVCVASVGGIAVGALVRVAMMAPRRPTPASTPAPRPLRVTNAHARPANGARDRPGGGGAARRRDRADGRARARGQARADGVTIGALDVGGLDDDAARERVRRSLTARVSSGRRSSRGRRFVLRTIVAAVSPWTPQRPSRSRSTRTPAPRSPRIAYTRAKLDGFVARVADTVSARRATPTSTSATASSRFARAKGFEVKRRSSSPRS